MVRLEARKVGRSQAEMLLDATSNRIPHDNFLSECGMGKVNNIKFLLFKDYSGCRMQNVWEGRHEGCDEKLTTL